MHLPLIALLALAAPTVEDFVDGAEIGTAEHSVAFQSEGKYRAETTEKKGKTRLGGAWKLEGDTAAVTVATCGGPGCAELKKDFKATFEVTAERAMTVRSDAPGELLRSGSYYCRMGGCEKRIGVALAGRGAKALTLNYLVDYLIDQNRKRDLTVVWRAPKLTGEAGKTRIEYCTREEALGKKGAKLVAEDLAALPWIGKLEPAASAEKDCLWDVRVFVADDVVPPARR